MMREVPQGVDYLGAMGRPDLTLEDEDLSACRPSLDANGEIETFAGNFTVTFRLRGRGDWAVRCFTFPMDDLSHRYGEIERFLRGNRLAALLPVTFIKKGVYARNCWHPIVKMPWIEGADLRGHLTERLRDREHLRLLQRQVVLLSRELGALNCAHGDLQHGNILVSQGSLKLIDYDGIYVPSLSALFPGNGGHPNFQHPDRAETVYDEHMDRFSFIVIWFSIFAAIEAPDVWASILSDTDDESLGLTSADFKCPPKSATLAALRSYPALEAHVRLFEAVCEGEYARIPALHEFAERRVRLKGAPTLESVSASNLDVKPSVPVEEPAVVNRGAAVNKLELSKVQIAGGDGHVAEPGRPYPWALIVLGVVVMVACALIWSYTRHQAGIN